MIPLPYRNGPPRQLPWGEPAPPGQRGSLGRGARRAGRTPKDSRTVENRSHQAHPKALPQASLEVDR